uniref:Phenol hydroxylase n=1 Tax=Parastrongyloides trichosuri TaxID=131310 RepID=A0A0N5A0R2_PARTI
ETAQHRQFRHHAARELHQSLGRVTHVLDCLDLVSGQTGLGLDQDVIDHDADHPAHGLQPQHPLVDVGPIGARTGDAAPDQRHIGQIGQAEQPRLHPVIHVVVVIGDVIGDGRALGLQRGEGAKPQVPVGRPARRIGGDRLPRRVRQQVRHRTVVLDHALDRLPAQVQAGEAGIAGFQLGYDAEALDVVIKAAERLHLFMQFVLARMAERRVSQIVGQGDRLGQIVVQPQGVGQRSGDLRHLKTVRQPGAIMVALMRHKDLRLLLQATEGGGVDDAVAVAGEGGAGAAGGLEDMTTATGGVVFGVGSAGLAQIVRPFGEAAGLRDGDRPLRTPVRPSYRGL